MKKLFGIVASSRSTGYDPDALSYINAVETADQFVLETPLKNAYNEFVVGCKQDFIWDPIKASCILVGARTLSGALVPLVGPTPTNFAFLSGDYTRTLGLSGNGSTKYLDSNRNNNADGQDNQHLSVYITSPHTLTTQGVYIGRGQVDAGTSFISRRASPNSSVLRTRSRASTVGDLANEGASTGLIGISRSTNTSYVARSSKTNQTQTITSQTPFAGNIYVFDSNSTATVPTNSRITFYSIGEALDLEKLDNRVTTLMGNISSASFFDSEAVDYVKRVEAADGQPLERPIQKAIIDFIEGCKADNIWSAIKASCLMCGARTLAGALTPLVGVAPTNINFVQADYNRKTGLIGNGTSKAINTNRNNNADPQDSNHNAVYVTEDIINTAVGPKFYIGGPAVNISGNNTIRNSQTTGQNFHNRSTSSNFIIFGSLGRGLKGHSRNNSTNLNVRNSQLNTVATFTSVAPANAIQYCFARNDLVSSSFNDCRISFYSIGEHIDLEKLENRLDILHTTLNSLSI